ncbi:hypothetical protein COEREDRAFT_89633 [Coemansia reversa NRRL 1564]|uniref:Uncharacterized protein n=1 Tax=Coemansia reversa (strain ATCC 12441 / NRRL 1564) TaxID=763665 RepID=A0A2G5B2W1_COERN|nr:hypothetical protein COEREDRAFT_89633 [Coemansia reversa NRRL 1564]|eukprot:PIA13353.1 hypothetical protein COEREDRAFT_89633 [Coemansia reversa NRRL 1564]
MGASTTANFEPITDFTNNPVLQYFKRFVEIVQGSNMPASLSLSDNECNFETIEKKITVDGRWNKTHLTGRNTHFQDKSPLFLDGNRERLYPFQAPNGDAVLRYSSDKGQTPVLIPEDVELINVVSKQIKAEQSNTPEENTINVLIDGVRSVTFDNIDAEEEEGVSINEFTSKAFNITPSGVIVRRVYEYIVSGNSYFKVERPAFSYISEY